MNGDSYSYYFDKAIEIKDDEGAYDIHVSID